jgi:hypothetical protein
MVQLLTRIFDALTGKHMLKVYAVLAAGAVVVFMFAGCEPKVQIPGRIAEQMQVDGELPLKTARTLLEDFRARSEENVKRDAQDLERLSGSIADAEAWQANMNALLWMGVDAASGQAQAIPGLGAVIPIVTGLLGLFMPRPRERKLVDAAYDMGRGDTLKTLAAVKAAPATGVA